MGQNIGGLHTCPNFLTQIGLMPTRSPNFLMGSGLDLSELFDPLADEVRVGIGAYCRGSRHTRPVTVTQPYAQNVTACDPT